MTDTLRQDDAWTSEQAARFLGLKAKTVYRWAAEGKLPSYKLGHARRFSQKALAAWRESRAHGDAA